MPECPQLPPADGQPCVSPAGTQARRVSTLIAELCGSLPLVKTKLFPRCANTMAALAERNSFPWWSTAAATGATRTRSLVRRTRSRDPDSGRRPSIHPCVLKNLVEAMALVSDGDNFLVQNLSEGDVTSPNYPYFNYPNNLEKTETIQVESGKVLRLEFTHFAVEWEPTCQYDYVRITEGDGTILMNNSCGYSTVDPSEPNYFQPPIIKTKTNTTSIFLRTNSLRNDPGWRLSWMAVTPGLELFCQDEKILAIACNVETGIEHQ